jgi:hypothetical protein
VARVSIFSRPAQAAPRLRRLLARRDRRSFLLELLPPASVGAEIGVWQGDFSARILEVVRPRRLHLIDPWRYEPSAEYERAWYGDARAGAQEAMDVVYERVCRRFARSVEAGIVEIHRLPSAEASDRFEVGSLDFVYVDGNHLYEFVKRDLELFAPKVREGGIVAGDDYGVEGWWKNGVTRAVDEFVAAGGAEVVALRDNQFVLRTRSPDGQSSVK